MPERGVREGRFLMGFFSAMLVLALTRAEIIDRFRAPPLTKVGGLVQAVGECPSDMREEFLAPVAEFAANVCRDLYSSTMTRETPFKEPGIVIVVGDVRTNMTDVVVKRISRQNGSKYTRIYLPAPGYADIEKMRTETAKAFFFAVKGEEIDDFEASRRVRSLDPKLRDEDRIADMEAFESGERTDIGDEAYLKMNRSVATPGEASERDILRFASHLRLYPAVYSEPFCGRYDSISFKEAVSLAGKDPRIRSRAFAKATDTAVLGGGRGEKLASAAEAYSRFLFALAAGKEEKELLAALGEADDKLADALEEARAKQKGK